MIKKFLIKSLKLLILPSFLTIFVVLLSSPLPLISKFAIDKVVGEGKLKFLPLAIAAFGGFALSFVLISYLKDLLFFKAQRHIITEMQEELVGRVLSYPLSFFSAAQTGELLSRIRRDTEGLQVLFSHSLVLALTDLLRFAIGIGILLKLNPSLTIICLLPVPFFIVNSFYWAGRYKQATRAVMEENARAEKVLSDVFMGISQVKESAKEKECQEKVSFSLRKYMEKSIKQNLIIYRNQAIVMVLSYVGEGLLLYFGIKEILSGAMSIGTLFAFQGYLYYLYGPSQRVSSFSIMIQHARAAWSRVEELLRVMPEEGGKRRLERIEEIEVRNLAFGYDGRGPLFEGLNFKVKRGEVLAIKGPSGAGKSTLVKLLLGLYRPQQGEILYNGVSLKELDLKWLRERAGYVSQECFMFCDTVEKNIAFGKEGVSREQIRRAAALSGALGFIEKLPQGFSTIVGEGGKLLSAGERQRIAIARAIIKEPDVIILDEAGSNLPDEFRLEIEERIRSLFSDRIIIVISHGVIGFRASVEVNLGGRRVERFRK